MERDNTSLPDQERSIKSKFSHTPMISHSHTPKQGATKRKATEKIQTTARKTFLQQTSHCLIVPHGRLHARTSPITTFSQPHPQTDTERTSEPKKQLFKSSELNPSLGDSQVDVSPHRVVDFPTSPASITTFPPPKHKQSITSIHKEFLQILNHDKFPKELTPLIHQLRDSLIPLIRLD